jgi:hypothetical protein
MIRCRTKRKVYAISGFQGAEVYIFQIVAI